MRIEHRYLWPTVCLVLLAGLIATAIDARNSRRAAKARQSKLEKKLDAPVFSEREQDYLREFGRVLGAPTTESPGARDAARLAAFAGIEIHKQRALTRRGQPATFPTRDFAATFTATVPLAAEMRETLPEFTQLRYELINQSDRTMPAPILFQQQRWDSAAELIATARLREVPDELDRAIAIWRFVSEHRDHALPPTESDEEHDLVKFFALYGYGFCDDAARAVSTLAELCGLQARVWYIESHVIAEIFAGGRWRMFDADQQAYFHRPNAPREILGIEELAQDRRAFETMACLTTRSTYQEQYISAFLQRDRHVVKRGGTSGYQVRPVLRPGERLVFTNYNWGRFFAGKYPTPGPRFHNGWLESEVRAGDFSTTGEGLAVVPTERGVTLKNRTSEPRTVSVALESAFPIVGGAITGTANVRAGSATLRLEDRENQRSADAPISQSWSVSLDGLVSVLTKTPTYGFTLSVVLSPGAEVDLLETRIIRDFQFARLAWIPLRAGENYFQAVVPEGCDLAALELIVAAK